LTVMGVKVTLHVSVIGPEEPWIVSTVTTVTGEPFCRLARSREVVAGAACVLGRQRREVVTRTRRNTRFDITKLMKT